MVVELPAGEPGERRMPVARPSSGGRPGSGVPDLSREAIWRTYDAMEARLAAPLTRRMLELAQLAPGSRVLDLATGRGEPAIPAAHAVGPAGRVVGVDPDAGCLAIARERADREGIAHLELHAGDAASISLAGFDVAFSRWGLMYMDRPVAALRATARALVPDGRLVVAVWADPARASYFSFPRQVLAKFAAVPPIDLERPGAFFYADPARLARDLALAGFRVERAEELEVDVMEARTGEELIAWTRAFGLAPLLDPLPEATRRAWEEELARAAPCRLGGVTRIVVARNLAAA